MIQSSPYTIVCDPQHAFQHTRIHANPSHPATRSRITLIECLESRGFTTVLELHWPTRVAIVWNLEQKRVETEVKFQETKSNHDNNEKESLTFCEFMFPSFNDDLIFVACRMNSAHLFDKKRSQNEWKEFNRQCETTCVFWPKWPYNKPQLDNLLKYLTVQSISNVIMITEQPTKGQSRNVMFQHRGIDCTFFSYDDLMFNITRHVCVPTYKPIPHDQLSTYKIQLSDIWNLPTLLKTDPICIFHGWKVGTVLQIQRNTNDIPEYRIVRPYHTYRPLPELKPISYSVTPIQEQKEQKEHEITPNQHQQQKQQDIRQFLKYYRV